MSLLENEILKLRPVEPEDLDLLYQVENDASLWWINSQNGPYSRFILRQYIANSTGDIYTDKQLRLVAIRKNDNKPIGLIDLFEFSPSHKRAEVGLVVFMEERRKNYGHQMLEILSYYSIRCLRLHQIYAYTPISNIGAVKLFRNSGFNHELVLEDWLLLEEGYSAAFLFQKQLG